VTTINTDEIATMDYSSGMASSSGSTAGGPVMATIEPDANWPGMWRVRWPDGRLSDMTNLTRAKDAVDCFMETEERRQRGRHSPLEGRLCVKTDSWGKGLAAE
jgi:hypothetical protein